ncbi:MAG: S41 family peptidase [Cyclobacteriaceae bacterium]
MKSKVKILFLAILMPLIAFSQKRLTNEQVLEDYKILKNVLTKGHPTLYEYTSKSKWDSLFTDFEKNKITTIDNNNDLYKSITELTDYVRDGHLIVMRPQLDSVPNLFPLWLKIINKKLYADTDDFGIPVGSEILSIDGVNAMELRDRLMKYAPSDGFNETKKDRQIEMEFGILHFYEFGAKPAYQVEYRTPVNEVTTKTVESQTFESIGKRFTKRNSFLAQKTLSEKGPHLYFIDSINIAVLTLNSFNLDVDRFQVALADIFKNIKRKKAKNLIIDIRQNEGGYPLNTINTFSYIANEPFKQQISSYVTTNALPEEQYSQNLVNGYTYETFFKKYFQNTEKTENGWKSITDENEPLMIPNKKMFEGKVYVLIGGKTFSAGSSFALFCKNQGITLVGEETGGSYYTQTGGYPIIYTLPNSKIKALISFVKISRYTKDETVKKGSGIVPDIEISLTVKDLIDRKDSQLNYVIKQINKE